MFPHPVRAEVEVGIPKPKNAVVWVVTIASYRGGIEHPKLCCIRFRWGSFCEAVYV